MNDLFFWYCVIVSAVLQYTEWRAKAAKIKRQEDLFIFNVKLWLLARGGKCFL